MPEKVKKVVKTEMRKHDIEVEEESFYGRATWMVYVKGLLLTHFTFENDALTYVELNLI
jgi:hypothetical protein